MKKISFLALLLFIYGICFAQQDTTEVLQALNRLEKALVSKDSIGIEKLLHPDLAFGHSNGWVQTKKEVLRDMNSGYVSYQKIESYSISIVLNKKYATVKERMLAEGVVNSNNFKVNLFVLQLWVKGKRGWQLMMRQSTKL